MKLFVLFVNNGPLPAIHLSADLQPGAGFCTSGLRHRARVASVFIFYKAEHAVWL